MAYFFALPSSVKQGLINYFSDKPIGTKIKHGFLLKGIAVEASYSGTYVLENSYIKLGKDIYALGRGKEATVGSGAFGKVKYIQALSSNATYVVKIQESSFDSSHSKKTASHLKDIEEEVWTLYDLGLYRDAGLRVTGKAGSATNSKHYSVMLDAGMPLNRALKMRPALSSELRYDVGIKVCWAVHSLHAGYSSRTNTPYAHRDIKPPNIARGRARDVRLIDVGLCYINPDSSPPDMAGAPAYIPGMMLYSKLTLRQLDVLALKRVMYMPNRMACLGGYKEDTTGRHFGLPMIFSRAILQAAGLFPYFDTSVDTKPELSYQGDPLTFASLLVLGRCNLVGPYAEIIIKNKTLAYAVLGLYFANQGREDEAISKNIDAAIKAYLLHRVAPCHATLALEVKILAVLVALGITNDLNSALNDSVLLGLIKDASVQVKKAAVLLWQNGLHKSDYLKQLLDNELLAKQVIQLVFDGEFARVRGLFTPIKSAVGDTATTMSTRSKTPSSVVPLPALPRFAVCKPEEIPCSARKKTSAVVSLPALPHCAARAEESTLKRAKPVSKIDKSPGEFNHHKSTLFFTPPKETRKPPCNAVENRPPWRF